MATYATIAEARDLYGNSYVAISESDEDAFGESLAHASARIDGYAEPYLPDGLPETAEDAPGWWKLLTIDIAIYFSSKTAGRTTKEKRQRYDDAIEMLESRYPTPEATPTTAPSSSLGASVDAGDRVFTRTTMRDLL